MDRGSHTPRKRKQGDDVRAALEAHIRRYLNLSCLKAHDRKLLPWTLGELALYAYGQAREQVAPARALRDINFYNAACYVAKEHGANDVTEATLQRVSGNMASRYWELRLNEVVESFINDTGAYQQQYANGRATGSGWQEPSGRPAPQANPATNRAVDADVQPQTHRPAVRHFSTQTWAPVTFARAAPPAFAGGAAEDHPGPSSQTTEAVPSTAAAGPRLNLQPRKLASQPPQPVSAPPPVAVPPAAESQVRQGAQVDEEGFQEQRPVSAQPLQVQKGSKRCAQVPMYDREALRQQLLRPGWRPHGPSALAPAVVPPHDPEQCDRADNGCQTNPTSWAAASRGAPGTSGELAVDRNRGPAAKRLDLLQVGRTHPESEPSLRKGNGAAANQAARASHPQPQAARGGSAHLPRRDGGCPAAGPAAAPTDSPLNLPKARAPSGPAGAGRRPHHHPDRSLGYEVAEFQASQSHPAHQQGGPRFGTQRSQQPLNAEQQPQHPQGLSNGAPGGGAGAWDQPGNRFAAGRDSLRAAAASPRAAASPHAAGPGNGHGYDADSALGSAASVGVTAMTGSPGPGTGTAVVGGLPAGACSAAATAAGAVATGPRVVPAAAGGGGAGPSAEVELEPRRHLLRVEYQRRLAAGSLEEKLRSHLHKLGNTKIKQYCRKEGLPWTLLELACYGTALQKLVPDAPLDFHDATRFLAHVKGGTSHTGMLAQAQAVGVARGPTAPPPGDLVDRVAAAMLAAANKYRIADFVDSQQTGPRQHQHQTAGQAVGPPHDPHPHPRQPLPPAGETVGPRAGAAGPEGMQVSQRVHGRYGRARRGGEGGVVPRPGVAGRGPGSKPPGWGSGGQGQSGHGVPPSRVPLPGGYGGDVRDEDDEVEQGSAGGVRLGQGRYEERDGGYGEDMESDGGDEGDDGGDEDVDDDDANDEDVCGEGDEGDEVAAGRHLGPDGAAAAPFGASPRRLAMAARRPSAAARALPGSRRPRTKTASGRGSGAGSCGGVKADGRSLEGRLRAHLRRLGNSKLRHYNLRDGLGWSLLELVAADRDIRVQMNCNNLRVKDVAVRIAKTKLPRGQQLPRAKLEVVTTTMSEAYLKYQLGPFVAAEVQKQVRRQQQRRTGPGAAAGGG